MQSLLIISKDKILAQDQIKKICIEFEIDDFDITIIEKATEKKQATEKQSQTIGIADIRNFQNKIFLKPLRSKIKAVVIKNSESLTIEAQNALLKILEEPPPNTIVILISQNRNAMLPTILSRCKVIELKQNTIELSEKENAQYLNILISLISSGIREKLKIAQDNSKTKEDALVWLEKIIITIRGEIILKIRKNDDFLRKSFHRLISQYLDILISFNSIYTTIKTTNVSPRFALENLLLNL